MKPDVEFEGRERILYALAEFAAGGDFADALLLAIARHHECARFASFDAALRRRASTYAERPS